MSNIDSRVLALKRDYKASRKRLGLSRQEIATKSNFSITTVKRFEDIEVRQEWMTAYKICKAVGINLYDYFEKAVVYIGPGKLIDYVDLDSYYSGLPVSEVFSEYQEEFIDNSVFFTGRLKFKYKGMNDNDIIKTVDGGRLNKGYDLTRNGLRVEGFIKSLSYKEIKELTSTR